MNRISAPTVLKNAVGARFLAPEKRIFLSSKRTLYLLPLFGRIFHDEARKKNGNSFRQTGSCPFRYPRPAVSGGAAHGIRGHQRSQAQYGQPRPVRLQAAQQRASGAGTAYRRGRSVLRRARHGGGAERHLHLSHRARAAGHHAQRRVHLQRRERGGEHAAQRADRHGRRDPAAVAVLFPVEQQRLSVRRQAGLLSLRPGERMEPGYRGHRKQNHRPHQGNSGHQPEQPDRRGLQQGGAVGDCGNRASASSGDPGG